MSFEQAYAAAGKVKHGSYYAMQDMTSEICNNVTVPSEQSTATLIDIRDNSTYTVAKLLDNRCWMTQNLRIQNKTLTAQDSDLVQNFFLPASSDYLLTKRHGEGYTNVTVYIDPNTNYGGYYNMRTATATTLPTGSYGYGSYGVSEYSICSKGWTLPSVQETTSLSNLYDYSSALKSPGNYVLSGGSNNGGPLIGRGEYGIWLTNDAQGAGSAYSSVFSFNPSKECFGTACGLSAQKGGGNTVRCIARN